MIGIEIWFTKGVNLLISIFIAIYTECFNASASNWIFTSYLRTSQNGLTITLIPDEGLQLIFKNENLHGEGSARWFVRITCVVFFSKANNSFLKIAFNRKYYGIFLSAILYTYMFSFRKYKFDFYNSCSPHWSQN